MRRPRLRLRTHDLLTRAVSLLHVVKMQKPLVIIAEDVDGEQTESTHIAYLVTRIIPSAYVVVAGHLFLKVLCAPK